MGLRQVHEGPAVIRWLASPSYGAMLLVLGMDLGDMYCLSDAATELDYYT